jgi:hypothetical protein
MLMGLFDENAEEIEKQDKENRNKWWGVIIWTIGYFILTSGFTDRYLVSTFISTAMMAIFPTVGAVIGSKFTKRWDIVFGLVWIAEVALVIGISVLLFRWR